MLQAAWSRPQGTSAGYEERSGPRHVCRYRHPDCGIDVQPEIAGVGIIALCQRFGLRHRQQLPCSNRPSSQGEHNSRRAGTANESCRTQDLLVSRVHAHGPDRIQARCWLKHVGRDHLKQVRLYCRMGPLHRKAVSTRDVTVGCDGTHSLCELRSTTVQE